MLILSPIAIERFVIDKSPILILKVFVLFSSVNPYYPGEGWVETEHAR